VSTQLIANSGVPCLSSGWQPQVRRTWGWLGILLIVSAAVSGASAADLKDYYGFGTMEILKLDWELGPVLSGDLNGDGLNDLLVCNNRKARIELLLQKANFDPLAAALAAPEPDRENVNDLFGRETAWRFKRFQYPLSVKATSLALGDFNHDDRPDLAYYSDEGLHLVLQDPAAPRTSGTLTEPVWQAGSRLDLRDGLRTWEALTAGDLNNDGRTDLVLLLKDGYYVLLQTAEGKLDRATRYYSSSENLRQIEIGDVDGDGRNDLVLLTGDQEEYPLRIRFQNPDGSLGPEGGYAIPVPSVLRLVTLDGSGKLGIASVSEQSGRFAIHALVPQGRREEAISVYPLPADDDAGKRDMTCADVDGDGLTDIVVTDPGRGQFLVLRGRSGIGLGPVTVYPGLKDMRKICAARCGSGPGDTLAVLSIDEKLIALSRFEKGRLSFPQTVPVAGEPQAMDLADLNADGETDLAYVAKAPGPGNTCFLRSVLSVGRENAHPGPSLELKGLEDKPQDMLACDIDHDGDTDLLVVRNYAPLLLVRQTTAGVFEPQAEDQTQIGLVSNLSPRAISLAPLGPQGTPALLAARGDFARSLSFDAEKGWQVIDQYQAGDRRHLLAVAAAVPVPSGTGLSIVGYDDASGIVTFMDPQADGTYRPARELNVGTATVRRILTGHFSSTTTNDLVLCAERKLICVWNNARLEPRQIAGFETTIEGGRLGSFTVGDINSDGVPDVILCEQGRYHVQILAFDDSARLVDACTFKVFEAHPHGRDRQVPAMMRGPTSGEPRQVLVADVTADGKPDLLLLVHDRIILYPQD
jgi:hypothetical protein